MIDDEQLVKNILPFSFLSRDWKIKKVSLKMQETVLEETHRKRERERLIGGKGDGCLWKGVAKRRVEESRTKRGFIYSF